MSQALYVAMGFFLAAWFWLWSIVDVLIGPAGRFRVGGKGLWLPAVALLPVVGGIAYLVFGRYVPVPPHEVDDTVIGTATDAPQEERPTPSDRTETPDSP